MLGLGGRLADAAALRARRALVGAAPRRSADGLPRGAVRRLARLSARVPRHLPHAADRRRPRALARRAAGGSPPRRRSSRIAALFVFSSPYLAPTRSGSRPAAPQRRRAPIAREQGLGDVKVDVEEVSRETRRRTPTRRASARPRVVLWDTLLDFPDDQVVVVLAHEFGHLSREHLLKSIGLVRPLRVPGRVPRRAVHPPPRRHGEPTAVPLSLFVVTVLGCSRWPRRARSSRRTEAEADWMALETTRDPAAAERLFQRFTGRALRARPARLVRGALVAPAVAKRIAMAVAWREREGAER